MNLQCLYCDSFIDVEDEAVCPCCAAPLSESIEAYKEEERIRLEEEERIEAEKRQAEREEAERLQRAEAAQQNTEAILELVGTALFSGIMNSAEKNNRSSQNDAYRTPHNQNYPSSGFDRRPEPPHHPQGFDRPMPPQPERDSRIQTRSDNDRDKNHDTRRENRDQGGIFGGNHSNDRNHEGIFGVNRSNDKPNVRTAQPSAQTTAKKPISTTAVGKVSASPSKPVASTKPASTTARPTSAPARPTSAPAKPTSAPARPTSATARPASAPTRPTSAPAKPTSATARPTSAPTRPASSTARPTSAPTRPASSTARPTSAPSRPNSDRNGGGLFGFGNNKKDKR